MAITADTIILASIAAALLIIVGLFISILRGLQSRRRLAAAHATVRKQDAQLADARVEFHGKTVALEQLRAQLQEKQAEIHELKGDVAGLQERVTEVLQSNTHLQSQQRERESRYQEQVQQLTENRDRLNSELKKDFENLANRIFDSKGQTFTHTSQATLEALLKPFREQIAGFQQRINEVHSESLKGNTSLESEIKKVLEVGLEMNSQASNLTTALKGDKKTTGNWGEIQLERALELSGLQAEAHYDTQTSFRDANGKRKLPDFIIKLPDGKRLVVDSKVSLVDYDRAIAADTEQERNEALTAHAAAVRHHIDDLASKDYADLPGIESPDFVLMFMPIEPAYIEAMKHNKDLFNYGYQKGVVMVSHTTLMPILRTVANLWMIEHSNQEAKEISRRAGDIFSAVRRVAERLDSLGASMRAAQNHYNLAVTSLVGKQGLHSKVERFQQISAKADQSLPELEAVPDELETDRLGGILQESDVEPAPTLVEPQHAETDNIKPIRQDQES